MHASDAHAHNTSTACSGEDPWSDGDGTSAWRQMCKRNVRNFLVEVKGMSKAEAKAWRHAHLAIEPDFVNYEDTNSARTAKTAITFTNEIAADGKQVPVKLRAKFDAHHRERRWLEHHADAQARTARPFVQDCTAKSLPRRRKRV